MDIGPQMASPSLKKIPTYSGFAKGWFSKRVVLADVPAERNRNDGCVCMFPRNEKPERGHIRQNHSFTKLPFLFPLDLWYPQLAFRVCNFYGGGAHFAARNKGPENRTNEVKLRPPLSHPLTREEQTRLLLNHAFA